MKILVTGYEGQLGYDVVRVGEQQGFQMIAPSLAELDITNEQDVRDYVASTKPNAIIHCAAYTAVDQAEDDKEACFNVNVNGTKFLAKAAKMCKAKLIYISTDYVFDGIGTIPYTESDIPNPKVSMVSLNMKESNLYKLF